LIQLAALSLWIALLMAAWCTTLSVQGALVRRGSLIESGARGLHASFAFALIAAVGLMTAFVGDDYSIRYVATHSGQNVETFYKICAFWSGGGGELLLAALMLGGVGSFVARDSLRRDGDRPRAAWIVATIGLMLGAVLACAVFNANPLAALPRTQGDGRGLDPMLRNPAMIVQPPLMLLGAACAAATAAIAIGAAMRRNFDAALVARLRALAAISWVVLSAAFLIAAHWAYASPGLRAVGAKNAAVTASIGAWAILTVVLVAIELRPAARAPRSDADVMLRRAGLSLAAVGAVLCAAMFTARPLTKNYDAQIGDGEQYRAKDSWGHEWTFASQGASRLERPGDDVTAVALLPMRDGVRQPFISSESRQYYTGGGLDVFPAQAVPGIRSTVAQDLFVMLSDAGEGRSVLRISFRPLVELGWAGGVLLAIAGMLLFWPPRAEIAS
jgi:cytochrome c biogenesis factor